MGDGGAQKNSEDFLNRIKRKFDEILGSMNRGLIDGIDGDSRHANGILDWIVKGVTFFVVSKTVGRVTSKSQRRERKAGRDTFKEIKRSGVKSREMIRINHLTPSQAMAMNEYMKRNGIPVGFRMERKRMDNSEINGIINKTEIESYEGHKFRNGIDYKFGKIGGEFKMPTKNHVRYTMVINSDYKDIALQALNIEKAKSAQNDIKDVSKAFESNQLGEIVRNDYLDSLINNPEKDAERQDIIKSFYEKKQIEGAKECKKPSQKQICTTYLSLSDYTKLQKNIKDLPKGSVTSLNPKNNTVKINYEIGQRKDMKEVLAKNGLKDKEAYKISQQVENSYRYDRRVDMKDEDLQTFVESANENGLSVVAYPIEGENRFAVFINSEDLENALPQVEKSLNARWEREGLNGIELIKEPSKEMNEKISEKAEDSIDITDE